MCAGMGGAIFGAPLFGQEINYMVSLLVRSQIDITFRGVILEKELFRPLNLIKFHIVG